MERLRLIAPVVKRAKDAARTIKQKTDLVINQVKDKTLTKLLELPNMVVTGYSIGHVSFEVRTSFTNL